MAGYKVNISKRAEKDLDRIRDRALLRRLIERIEALGVEPRPAGVRKIMGSEMDYRIRIGDYRVIYQIDDASREILVCGAGHRKDIYRGL